MQCHLHYFYEVAKWKIGVEAEQENSLGCIVPVHTKWVVFVCVGEGGSLYSSPDSSRLGWSWPRQVP